MEELKHRLHKATGLLSSSTEEWAQEAGRTFTQIHGLLDRPIEDTAFELVGKMQSLAAMKERLGSVSPEAAETVELLSGWTMKTFTEASRMVEPQVIELKPLGVDGFVLDIGGGGEGVIGRLMGRQVVAIDKSWSELEETTNEALKLVMDATDLKFLDGSFDAVTSFYTLMYMDDETHRKVLREAYRVLRKGGTLHVWDVAMDPDAASKPFILVSVEARLPGETIKTSYGHRLNKKLTIDSLSALGEDAGFTVVESRRLQGSFYLVLRKS